MNFPKLVADAISVSRLPLGAAVGWFLYAGNFTLACALYVIGLLTDVADGFIARQFHCTSSSGAELDRRCDIVFNGLATIGYVCGAYLVWGNWKWALAPFAVMGGLMALTRPFFQPHSAAAKLRSGAIRLLLVGFVFARLTWGPTEIALAIAFLAFGIPTAIHEWKTTVEEVRSGKRRWFKRPPEPNTT